MNPYLMWEISGELSDCVRLPRPNLSALEMVPLFDTVQKQTEPIGCWTCILACTYGSIRQDTLKCKSVKCDLFQGDEIPAGVLNCPNEALTCEEVTEVLAK